MNRDIQISGDYNKFSELTIPESIGNLTKLIEL